MKLGIIKSHLALVGAAAMWGLMSPLGKMAMDAGITGLAMANIRMMGGAVCFWTFSIFAKSEPVPPRDLLLLFYASLLGIVLNQGCFTFGLSLTSPIDASIVTTTMPIVTMILAAVFLKEPVTPMKVGGIFLGSVGALMLILGSGHAGEQDGSMLGDALCVLAQTSFACYLTIFKKLIGRYSVFTLMKWMFTYAAICFIPFSYHDFATMDYPSMDINVWLCVAYVVFFGTFIAYLLMVIGQKTLRPTVVSMYNYVQPVVGTLATIYLGLATFGWGKAVAAILIFVGVYAVTQSKSRAQMIESGEIKDA